MAETHGNPLSLEGEGQSLFIRKGVKLLDLPITSTQRSSIDSLLHTLKKKGEFDDIRKRLFKQFEEGTAKQTLTGDINELVEFELERNPSLLSKDRHQTAPLVQGAADRSTIFRRAQETIEQLVAKHLESAGPALEAKLREIRIKDVGDQAAAEEERRGSKTEADYAAERATRKEQRNKERREEYERQKALEKEARRALEEEREKFRLEMEKKEAKRKEVEEKRKAEYEAQKQKEREEYERAQEEKRKRQEQYEREREEERERRRQRRQREEEEYQRERERHIPQTNTERRSPSPPDEKRLEEEALELLLKEGQDLARSRSSKPTLERSDSLEPPPRKTLPPKSIVPRDPVAARLAKLSVKSEGEAEKPSTPLKGEPLTPSISKDQDDSRYGSHTRSPSHPSYREDDRSSRHHYDYDKRYSRHDDHDHRRSSRYNEYCEDKRSSRHEHRDRDRDHDHDHDVSEERIAYKDKLRRDRDRERDTGYKRSKYDNGEEDEYHEERRHRHRDRSRERDRGRDRSPRRTSHRDRDRSRSPVEIDRYVPSTSSRAKQRDTSRDRERERERERDYRGSRDYRGGREEREKYHPVEIDRYVPGGSSRKPVEEERAESLKKRERSRSRSRGSRR
ncbi:MAG: hypothetical protein M1821_000082 [Bathelium mastoideum]|nr:MAG: hypothetical protein M1821_000082 [Bathelium mastoideum]KAI9687886.1 MAG: hypothetical protein M1822_001967 [Bathelium mastoideum]